MPDSLQVALQNQSNSSEVYAYVTGIAIQHNGARCLLKANGRDLYFPESPSAIGSQLTEDCAIPLGPPGNTTTITLPQIAGGRIWFAQDGKLTFLLNPGPALVEPSVLNPSDPNWGTNFGFCEFTLNQDQLYANISYVDFVPQIPIALTLQSQSGAAQHVAGMPPDGLDKICDGLHQQAQADGRPWDKLTVQQNGKNHRVLNSTHGDAVGANFDGYYEPYVDQVWQKLGGGSSIKLNTQAGPGVVDGAVNNGQLVVGGESFQKPSTADILGCNTGPFTTGPSPARNAIIPRLAAGFIRSTLLTEVNQPSDVSTYYRQDPTNHYCRIVHLNNVDEKGYTFAYDDVTPDGGADQSGKVNSGDPTLWTIAVGGNNASAGGQAPASQPQQQTQPQQGGVQEPQKEGGKFKSFMQKIIH